MHAAFIPGKIRSAVSRIGAEVESVWLNAYTVSRTIKIEHLTR
jgi:hypothetical protein